MAIRKKKTDIADMQADGRYQVPAGERTPDMQTEPAPGAFGYTPAAAASSAAVGGKTSLNAVTKETIDKAAATMQQYKNGKSRLESRIVDCDDWWSRHHEYREERKNDIYMTKSGWLANAIENKHADAMDNTPEASCLPQERNDEQAASTLSSIIPVVLEQNDFEKTYSDCWYDKLKSGTAVYGVFWNGKKENGLGDVDIQQIEVLNLFWEPGIKDIQKSKNVFHAELWDNELLKEAYPQLKDKLGTPIFDVAIYTHDDTIDVSEKSVVVDWYYKRNVNGKNLVHYVKFCNGELLYASENDPAYAERGFYDHGLYPFIFDPLYPIKDSPCGFGIIDAGRDTQYTIDAIDNSIVDNARKAAKRRYFVRADGSINEKEFADFSKDFVHYSGSGDPNTSIMAIETPALGAIYENVLNNKIAELKEVTSNRDFAQGGTASGVSAASAIAALQEAGSKTSRDIIAGSYRAYKNLVIMIIELIRQFYNVPRVYRITGDNSQTEYMTFDNADLMGRPTTEMGVDIGTTAPIFDVKVKAHKKSAFSRVAQNELAKELYGAGFFDPSRADVAMAALSMMEFEGVEQVKDVIRKSGGMYQQLQMQQAQIQQLSGIVDQLTGAGLSQSAAALPSGQQTAVSSGTNSGGITETNALGRAVQTSGNTQASTAAQRASSMATPGKDMG